MQSFSLLLVPLLIALGAFLLGKKKVTHREFLIQVAISVVLAFGSVAICKNAGMSDINIHNGQIVAKKRQKVHCRHSYECNCNTVCSGSGSHRSCNRVCQTCYEHPYDVDWRVYTNINESFLIDTIDRQGLKEPPRWTQVKIGEPYSSVHSYHNYIKASPETLFRNDYKDNKYPLPNYPSNIYDYHRLNRFITQGIKLRHIGLLNKKLSKINSIIGPKKEANFIIVLTKDMPEDYFYYLKSNWIGAKKNDIVLVMSTDGKSIQWADVMAWTQTQDVQVQLKDLFLGKPITSINALLDKSQQVIIEFYNRKPMEDFKYLTNSFHLSLTQWIVCFIINLLISIGITVYCWKNDETY